MKPPRIRTLFTPFVLLLPALELQAAVNITSPAVPDPFAAVPAATDWSTVSVAGAAPADAAALDAAVIANTTSAGVLDALGSSPTNPPSANAIARYNTTLSLLQTRPTGNAYTLLMATLVNATGGALNTIKLNYDYSKETDTASEVIKGPRVYFSTTGNAGDWTLIPELSVDTTGTPAAPQAMSVQFAPAAPLADGATVYVLWADQNSSGTDASYHIDNFAASPGLSFSIAGSPIAPVRQPGADAVDPADDTVTFSTTVTATGVPGPGWVIASGPMTGTTGNYGDTVSFNLPISDFAAAPVTVRFQDQTTAEAYFQTTVTAPPFAHKVTADNSPTITFTPSAVGDGSYVPPLTTLTEPGWSGGTTGANTASNVQTQPPPSTETLKYFHMTSNAALTTNAVDVNAVKGSLLKGEFDIAFYSTSTSELDADADILNFRIEVALDGNFGNTTPGNIITMNIKDVPLGEGPAFSASIPAANPYINIGAAFPAEDFTFHRLSANMTIPADAPNPHARIVAQGIAGISNSEHLLIDNITFRLNNAPSLDAVVAGTGTWSNNGTVTPADDTFSVPVNITGFNLGASPGWNSNETPVRTGAYTAPNPVLFGPYPGRTPVTVQLSDQLVPAATTGVLTLAPPASSLTLTPVNPSLVRNPNGPGDADDTVSFQVEVSGANGGPEFRIDSYPTTGTTPDQSLTPVPVIVTVTLFPVPDHGTVVVYFRDASYPAVAAALLVDIPTVNATQYIIGQKDFGGGLSDVVTDAASPLAPEWFNYPGIRTLEMTNGGGVTTKTVTSERIDLATVSGTVNFSARLRAIDRTTGFEATDTFHAELIIDDDFNNPVNLITPYDTILADGLLAGGGTAAEDEFNLAKTADGTYVSDFALSHPIPDSATSVQLRITAVNDSTNETFIVENVLFSLGAATGDTDGDGVSDANEAIMGTSTTDANDVLRLSQNAGNPNQLDFPTKAGRFYRVYVSNDANEASHLQSWNDSGLATIAGDGNPASFSITVAAGEARRFYRLHVMTTDGPWPATAP